uniref:AUGMIN subunit 5 n=1 Tax=Kalanchoe fedtschenkoi TaxID=63787 RepID=A0A7N0VLF9_KALFE
MQGSSSAAAQPEAILEWLHKEMGYRPLAPYSTSTKSHSPSADSIRKVCRGNMIPVWNFLLARVKSEKTVEKIRRNIHVHGGPGGGDGLDDKAVAGRRKESAGGGANVREAALQEREVAEKEVERLRNMVRRQRKDLRARMLEVSREEAERKRMVDERSNYRHKQVTLEAYDQQCDEAAKIFIEYHKRIRYYVTQARDAQRSTVDTGNEMTNTLHTSNEKEAVYSTVRGAKSSDDVILVETTRERNIRKACESLASYMIEKIRHSFPAYEGNGISLNPQSEVEKLSFDCDGEVPDDIKTVIVNCLRSPPQLIQAITAYTLRLRSLISREIEKIDVRADAEALRYTYENDRVMDASSDACSQLQYQLYGNGKICANASSRGSHNQLLERQKAHVQQFLATEDAVNQAAEASDMSKNLIKRLHSCSDTSSNSLSLRHFELEVWAKEREVAGLKASLNTLTSEIQRLNKLCKERKEAEDSLKMKWKKIEEFDARRSELESVYTALLKANMDAAAVWNQQPLAAREYASSTIIPVCQVVMDISNNAKDLIDKEVSAFYRSPDNTLYMLPSTPHALLESMGANGSTGPDVIAAAEKNAAILTARAGSKDPSAIPSICRVSAALQYPGGIDGSDAGLASVLESLEFCMKLRGSEASVLEDLAKAINLVHLRKDLVESGHTLLNHAYRAQQEYERTTNYCLNLASEQEKTVNEKWLPELKASIASAKKSLEDCKYVRGLVAEWWEQPAATVVDWVTVDGQNVTAWHNHVKQLLAFYDKELL